MSALFFGMLTQKTCSDVGCILVVDVDVVRVNVTEQTLVAEIELRLKSWHKLYYIMLENSNTNTV